MFLVLQPYLSEMPASSVFSLWHSRLGHVYESRLKYGVSFGQLGHLPPTDISSCLGCQLGKHTALPLTSSTTQTYAPFKLIHSAGSCSCFVKKWLCICCSICFLLYSFHLELHRRSDFLHVYKNGTTMIATEFSARMLFFRSDAGGTLCSGSHAYLGSCASH